MTKQEILNDIKRIYKSCLETEETNRPFKYPYMYGRLMERIRNILDSEKELIKDDLRGIFINRKT